MTEKRLHKYFLVPLIVLTAILIQIPVFAAEEAPYDISIKEKKNGDILLTMTEPREYTQNMIRIIGLDLTELDTSGNIVCTFRLGFDKEQSKSGMNQSNTAKITEETVSSEDLRTAMDCVNDGFYEQYLSHEGSWIIDPVAVVSSDYGENFSSAIYQDGDTGLYRTVVNLNYPDAAKILALDPDKDMAFGADEELRLKQAYEWNHIDAILDLYNQPLSYDVYHAEEAFEESSCQDEEENYPDEAELGTVFQTWEHGDGDEESPSVKTYNASRNYEDGGTTVESYESEDPIGLYLPAGGAYLNGLTVDSMFGTVQIGLRGAVHTWDFTYDYSYQVIRRAADGSSYLETLTGTIEMPITRRAYYYYIWSMDLYDFDGAVTENGAIDEKTEYYPEDAHLTNEEIEKAADGPVTEEDLLSEFPDGTTTARPDYRVKLSTLTDGDVQATKAAIKDIDSFVPDDDSHVSWARIRTDRDLGNVGYTGIATGSNASRSAETAKERAREKAWILANEAVGNGADMGTDTTSDMDSFAKVTNDYLRIGYDGTEVLDGSTREVRFKEDDGEDYRTEYDADEVPWYLRYVISDFPDSVDTETYETTPAFGKELLRIPDDAEDGEYFTSVSAAYTPVMVRLTDQDREKLGFEEEAVLEIQDSYNAIKEEYAENEPLYVSTPEKSPITIRPEEIHEDVGIDEDLSKESLKETQLVSRSISKNLIHLKLDEDYWLSFDDTTHLEEGNYTDSETHSETWNSGEDTDQYTAAKYVHFPFDVMCLWEDGSRKYCRHSDQNPVSDLETDPDKITKKDSDGGQYWVELSEDAWAKIHFYIPPWATEAAYNLSDRAIQYRVEVQNVDAENEEGAVPVKIYHINSQVSGWLYDFQILGTNDSADFGTEGKDLLNAWYPFALNGEEKKTGTKNRLGETSVRFAKTGETTDAWEENNTIPLANGKSNRYAGMGMLPKGSSFTYSVKTISNLWHDQDYLQVIPTFTYTTADGLTTLTQDEFTLYYNDYTGEETEYLKKYDPNGTDTHLEKVSLADSGFSGSFLRSDLELTAQKPEVKWNSLHGSSYVDLRSEASGSDLLTLLSNVKSKQTEINTFGITALPSALRVFYGSAAYMKENLSVNRTALLALDSYIPAPEVDANPATADGEEEENARKEQLLRVSMQEWYGKFTVPEELFVTTKTADEIASYASEHGGITKDANIFEQGGYLTVNFTIVSVRNNSEDLVYGPVNDLREAERLNMWARQGEGGGATVALTNGNIEDLITHTVKYGDVAIIDLSKKLTGYYQAGKTRIH